MKTRFSQLFSFAICMFAVSFFSVSCSEDEFINNKGNLLANLQDFRFSTTQNVMLDVDYGQLSSRALIEVYGENPLENATAENQAPQGDVIFSAFLDEKGTYCGEVEIPAHVKHLYVYSPSMSAPQLMDADLKSNIAKFKSSVATSRSISTRTVSDDKLVVRKLNSKENGGSAQNFYTIVGGWDDYGKVEDPNHLVDEGTLTGDDVNSIEHYFWMIDNNKTSWSKPGNPEGARLKRLQSMRVEDVNMVVQEQYEENGQIYDVESAEVWFTFLTEYAWNENTVGYYFFDKNNPPKSAAEIDKKFVILPSASKPKDYPFDNITGGSRTHFYPLNSYPTEINQRIQLLYVDNNGKVSKHFPPNTEIGFFLISNGFRVGKKEDYTGANETIDGFTYTPRVNGLINTNGTTYYSNKNFNSGDDNNVKNPKSRYVACRLANGTVVYGCEDGTNSSYDDMMFTITASPNKAIHTQEGSVLQEIPQKLVPRTYTDNSENYTFAFEDIWPNGGDYDLNDVIVRLSRKITKDQFNDVSEVVDEYTFEVNETTKAKDAFGVQIGTSHKGNISLPNGAWFEDETGTIFLTENARAIDGQTLRVVRTFSHPITFDEIKNELNPFVVNQSSGPGCRDNSRIEIHLPMGEVTSKGKHVDNVKNPAKAWYISDDGKYPYALKISDHNFVPCSPGVKIGSGQGAYPDFNSWVNSLGQNFKTWYKNK